MEEMNWWDHKYRWYLHDNGSDIGPFKSMTEAWRHRRDFGPKDWEICQVSDIRFIDSLWAPKSPEAHRWETSNA